MIRTKSTTQAIAVLHTLTNADGSATYTSPHNTHRIIAGVNYPIEVPFRSDEIPESTYIEVNLRPHNGVGMVKERHVEQLVKRTLATVVLAHETPRTMLQVTLQVVGVEVDEEGLPGGVKAGGQGESYLDLLVASVNAGVLGCLDAGVQMREVVGAVLVGVDFQGGLVVSPTVKQRKMCGSLHAFGFLRSGEVVLMESEGRFRMEEWEAGLELARKAVLGEKEVHHNGDVDMNGVSGQDGSSSLMDVMRQAVIAKVANDDRWKE